MSDNTIPANTPYEAAFAELKEVVHSLESGDVPLEEALQSWERGEALIKHCQGILDAAAQRLAQLNGNQADAES